MKFYLLLLPLVLVGAPAAYAQQSSLQQTGTAAQANLDALVSGSPTVLPRGEAYGVNGSPYLDKRWLPARLQMANKIELAPVPLKVDVLERRLLMRPFNRPNDSLVLDDRLLVGFTLDEPAGLQPARVRKFRRFVEAPVASQQMEFVEIVHEGKFTLLKRYAKTLRQANYQGAYSTGNRYDEIEDKTQYYLKRFDGTLVPLKLTLKMLQAAAPQLAAPLKAAPRAGQAKTDADWAAVLNEVDPQ